MSKFNAGICKRSPFISESYGAASFGHNRIKNEVDIAKNAVSISFIFAI